MSNCFEGLCVSDTVFSIYQAKFEVQDVEYYSLMNEKETEEREEFILRLYLFKANRAARIIQRWWRGFYKSRSARMKKSKKGKKK